MKEGKDLNNTTIEELMPVNPIVINQNKDMEETISIKDKNGIFMIPLVEDDRRIVGICPRREILKEILNEISIVIAKKNYYNNNR